MQAPVRLILLILAFLLFTLAVFGVPAPPRLNLVALGLACWMLTLLLA